MANEQGGGLRESPRHPASEPGRILVLNGTSSAGKSTVLHAFQESQAKPYIDMGLDKFIFALPKRYLRTHWQDVLGAATHGGAMGHTLVAGMHRAIAAIASTGLNVVTDHVLVEKRWIEDCAAALAGRARLTLSPVERIAVKR